MLALAKYYRAALATIGLGGAVVGNAFTQSNKNYSTTGKPAVTTSKLDFKLPAFAATAPKVYLNPLSERVEMFKDLKGKSGVRESDLDLPRQRMLMTWRCRSEPNRG